jgi:hypothetical protein
VFTALLLFHTNGRYILKTKKCLWALRGRIKRVLGKTSCWGGSELADLYKCLYSDRIKEDERGGSFSRFDQGEKFDHNFNGKMKGKRHCGRPRRR